MNGIQLKMSGQWVVLPPDFSLKMEQTNALFSEEGAFSYPFEIPLEPNRSLFKNVSDPFSDIRLEDIDNMEAELWFQGVLLYTGIMELDTEIEFDDAIPMTFLSGNSGLNKLIENLNAQDIPLDRDIKLGYLVTKASEKATTTNRWKIEFPDRMMMNYTGANISDPYPLAPYCNVRVCTSDENGRHKVLEARRPFSGVCFYALYLIDLLFAHLKICIVRNDLSLVEDMNRLAFFTTKCENRLSDEEDIIPLSELKSKDFCGEDFMLVYHLYRNGRAPEVTMNENDFIYRKRDVFATNKNFPEVEVADILSDFNNAFGVRFIHDMRSNNMQIVYLKDIFKDNHLIKLDIPILSYAASRRKNTNIAVSYGVSDNTAFNYNDYDSAVVRNGYAEVLGSGINTHNRICCVDSITGNAYRVKVNKETGKDPCLFEVGGFRDYATAPEKVDDVDKISITFAPVITNDVTGGVKLSNANDDRMSPSRPQSPAPSDTSQVFAVFADVELLAANTVDDKVQLFRYGTRDFIQEVGYVHMRSKWPERYNTENNEESPLKGYDPGYVMGIMRGPGSDSNIEYKTDYDGEGNNSWVQTVANYAFTSDSCDSFGRFFDYNGTEEGGADQSGRFSLKLIAGKDQFPIGDAYADRGLVNKFLSEYLYFLEHRKTVTIEVRMNISQLINIDFLKRYQIGDFVGYINKISYTLDADGMEDVLIEMYTI